MAFINCTFFSETLQKSVQFNAIIPKGKESGASVLYLLHGLTDDYTAWSRYTSIERYANDAGIVIIMPDGGRSFYTDMAYGGAYYTFFTKEFFPYIQKLFRVSQKREDTFIAGLSMGGYGALKIALLNPEVFSAVASLSGAVNVSDRLENDPRWADTRHLVFGDAETVRGTENDLFFLAANQEATPPVRIYLACGTEDFLFRDNLAFADVLSKTSIPYQFDAAPGIHEWKFWDTYIQKALFFFLEKSSDLRNIT